MMGLQGVLRKYFQMKLAEASRKQAAAEQKNRAGLGLPQLPALRERELFRTINVK